MLLGWLLGFPPLEQIAWQAEDFAWALPATLPVMVFGYALLKLPLKSLRRSQAFVWQMLAPLAREARPFQLALIAVLAGVGEEMLFRGVLQPLLARHADVWTAILATSLLFGLLHRVTWSYALFATAVSVYLGWLMTVSGNLLVPIVAHCLYDAAGLFYLRTLRGGPPAGVEEVS